MDISGIEATQALDFGDGGDETDEDIDFNTPVAYLNVRCQKGFPGKLFPIYEGDNIIGRHDGCQVAIPLKALSREHACIEVSAGSHFIYDKGSRNRTKRNKHFLAAAVRYELKDKDKLIFGDVETEFQLHPANNNDDGSDTESESMFQTAPADDVVPAEDDGITAPADDDDDDDDGCDSDASCDILQPTQQFTKNTQSTSIFGTKAQLGETTIAQNITVEDTPEINRTKRLTDSIVIPESGSDTEGEEEICKDKSGDISRLMVAETQSYVCESDVTTDDEDNSVDKSSLLVAPTQAFVQGNNDDDDISTCDEASPQKKQLMMAATQAYVDSDDHASPKKKIMFEPTQAYDMDVEPAVEVEHKVGVEPTVHYDMDEGVEPTVRVEPTQAYDMDTEEDVKTEDEKRPGILFEPTQAYTGYDDDTEEDDDNVSETSDGDKVVGFDDPTLAVETGNNVDEESETPVVEKQSEKVETKSNSAKDDNNEAGTQVCDEEVESKTNVPINDNETETQICDDVPDESEKNNDNKVEKAKSEEKTTQGFDKQADPTQTFNDEDGDTFDFLATSTLAVDDVDSGESNTSSTKDTANVDFNQPTQVFDNVDETCAVTEDTVNDKPKRKVCSNNEDATQVFNNDIVAVQDDATVAVEDADISKDSKCSSKARKSKISKKQCVPESVPIIDNDGQTQVFDQTVDINEITKVVKPAAKGKAAISASDQPTQVFDETVPVEDMTDVKDSAQGKNAGPTQVFDETVPVEDIQVTTKANKQTRATTTKNKVGSEMNEPTQVFDDTLAVEETSVEVKQTRGGKKTKKSARNKKQSAMEDATQVFDETVAVEEITNLKEKTTTTANEINSGDQPTQVIYETLPANEIPDIKTKTTKRGKKQAIVENQIAEDEPTQVFDEPTTSKSEDLKAGEDQTQVFEENVEDAAMVSKPVRKGKRGAKKAQDNNASTTEGSTQVFDETVVSQDMQGSSEGATQVFDDTDSVSEETNVKPGVRKGGRRKQTKIDAANDTVETNNTRTSRTRGRGSKTATKRQTESEETTIANETVLPKNSGRNEPTKDTDEVAEQPIDSVRKSGRSKRNYVKKDAEKEDVQKVSIENKKGKKKANKPTVEIEAATQLYGDEDPTVTDAAATQRYGDNNEEEDLTPDIDTVLAEEANQRNNPPVVETVIPAKSPLKSALASPKKERSPSPKKVQFVSQKSETGSESSQTSRRSNRSNKGKSKYSVDKDASDSKPVKKNSKNKKDDETNSAVDVTTNIPENVEEKVPPVRKGRGRRAVQSIDPVQDTETVSDNVKQTEVTSKRQGRSKTSDNSSVKNESENMIEETADLTENTSKVIKRGGRKSTNSVGVNQKTNKNTRTSLPTVLEDNTDNSSTEKSKTNARQGNRRGAKRKVEETSDAKNMDDEQNVVADDVKEKPSTSKGSKNKEEESESIINNEESKGAENDNTDNSSLRPSRRGTRHTESNESTIDNSKNAISDKKISRGTGVKKDVKSDNVKVNESNASEVETNTDNVEVKGNSQKGNDSAASKSESDSQVGVNRRGKRNSEVSTSKSDMDTREQKTQEKGRGNKRSTRKNAGGDDDTLNDTTDNKDSSVKKEDEDSKTTKTTGRVKRKGSISIDSQESESSGTPAKKQKKGNPSAVSTPVSSKKQPKQLDESMTHSPQLRKTTIEGVKAKVMFTGVVDEQGQKIVKELGGELVNAVMDCTHLVTDQVRRTVKFLCCLSRGIPIVVPQWLTSSKASGFFVDSAPFLVTDDATEKKFKFRLMHSIEKANQERLFEGYTIHVTKSVKPEPMQMKEILNCAGAKYSDKMPTSNASGHTVVISCEEDKSLCTAAVKAGIPVMTAEFVLTGILRQDVDLISFKLDIDTNCNKRFQPDSESEPAKKRRR